MIKLKIDEDTEDFLHESQILAICFTSLFVLAVGALTGAFTGVWVLFQIALIPISLLVFAGFAILAWRVGTKVQSIVFRRLEVEEDND